MNQTDRAKAYRTLKPLIHSFIASLLLKEQDDYEMWQQHPFSECQRTALRIAPGRIEMLNELPALLDKEMEE